jgi:hypothetical protein
MTMDAAPNAIAQARGISRGRWFERLALPEVVDHAGPSQQEDG